MRAPAARDGMAYRTVAPRLQHRRAERQVDDVDLMPLAVGDHPLDAGTAVADVARAVGAEIDTLRLNRAPVDLERYRTMRRSRAAIAQRCRDGHALLAGEGSS